MWRAGVILKCALIGAIGGPFVGCALVSYEANEASWAAIKAEMVANLKLSLVLATVGALIGVIVGFVKVAKGEKEVSI